MQTPAEGARSALPAHIQSAPERAPLSKHTPRARLERAGAHPKMLEKLAEHAPRARAERADRTFQSPPCNAPNAPNAGMAFEEALPLSVGRGPGKLQADKRRTRGRQQQDKRTTRGRQQQDKRRTREEDRTTAGQGQVWSARPEDNGRTGPSQSSEARPRQGVEDPGATRTRKEQHPDTEPGDRVQGRGQNKGQEEDKRRTAVNCLGEHRAQPQSSGARPGGGRTRPGKRAAGLRGPALCPGRGGQGLDTDEGRGQ